MASSESAFGCFLITNENVIRAEQIKKRPRRIVASTDRKNVPYISRNVSVKCQICIKFDSSIIEINYFIHDIGLFGYDLRTILIVMMAVSLSVLVDIICVCSRRTSQKWCSICRQFDSLWISCSIGNVYKFTDAKSNQHKIGEFDWWKYHTSYRCDNNETTTNEYNGQMTHRDEWTLHQTALTDLIIDWLVNVALRGRWRRLMTAMYFEWSICYRCRKWAATPQYRTFYWRLSSLHIWSLRQRLNSKKGCWNKGMQLDTTGFIICISNNGKL